MSANKSKYFIVSHVVKANNKTEAAKALARQRGSSGTVFSTTPLVERISATEAREWADN